MLSLILAATLLGPAVKHLLGGHAMAAVVIGGCCMVLAAVALSWVPEEKTAA